MFQGIKKIYFHAHLKNVFLAMLSNKSEDIRRIAIEKIITAEKKSLEIIQRRQSNKLLLY